MLEIEKFKCHRNEHLSSIAKFKALDDNEVQVNSRKGDRTSDDNCTSQVTTAGRIQFSPLPLLIVL